MVRSSHPLVGLARALAVAAIGLLLAPAAALAKCPQTSLAEIEEEVMCPVCGTPLALATEAPQAERQREFIVERIERCQSEGEIKASLVAQFGEEVLATPGDEGFDLVAYLLPALAVVAGAGAVALAVVRWRRSGPRTPVESDGAAPADPSSVDAARLSRDLERYDL